MISTAHPNQRPPVITPIITVDGPSAAGKGATARALAAHLGFDYLDSGALYRAFAYFAKMQDPPLDMANAPKAMTTFQAAAVLSADKVLLHGEDISAAIRTETIGKRASILAAMPTVREGLIAYQRRQARAPGLIADGRDMGTVIFPDAPCKFFLTASAAVRAARRHAQLGAASPGKEVILQDLRARDRQDATRTTAPLVAAPDAVTIQNDEMTLEAVVARMVDIYTQKIAAL